MERGLSIGGELHTQAFGQGLECHGGSPKARAEAEKTATREAQQQERIFSRIKRSGITLGSELIQGGSLNGGIMSMMGALGMIGAPAALAVGGGMLVQELTKDYMERQGIANRDKASRAGDIRGLGIRSGWRGTSSQAQAAEFGTEDEIFQREQDRAEILRRNQRSWYNPLRMFGKTTWEGLRERHENEKNIQRLRERRNAEEAQAREKFENEEGGLELDALRQRSSRTMAGQRGARVDEETRRWLGEYRRFRSTGATDSQASEAGKLTVQNELMDQQARAGASLVDARAGAGDIAAAARWAQASTPNWNDIGKKIDSMHGTLKNNGGQDYEAQTRKDW